MPLTLDTTLTGEFANSYVDASYCDDYWSVHQDQTKAASWQALTTGKKESLLIRSCRVIESVRFVYPWDNTWTGKYRYLRSSGTVVEFYDRNRPRRYREHQALQFPRNVDRELETGDLYIPEAVKMAQCEQAVYLLTFDDSALATRMQGVERDSTKIGQISVSQTFAGTGSMLSPVAREFLSPFFVKVKPTLGRA
jgi:hypothetical protein